MKLLTAAIVGGDCRLLPTPPSQQPQTAQALALPNKTLHSHGARSSQVVRHPAVASWSERARRRSNIHARTRARFQHVTDRSRARAALLIGVSFRLRPSRWVNSGVRMMARRPPNDGASWSARELKTLRALAKAGTPTGQVAKKLGRTAAAVQQKAMRAGISFRAAKRAGARRKK
jgi:hypothetical protein